MEKNHNFTQGAILMPLVKFAIPMLMAMLLQSAYGAVDLMVVGQFALPLDVSAVSTGTQIMMSLTVLVTGAAMAVTILLGQYIGQGRPDRAGEVVGTGICLFVIMTLVMTFFSMLFANQIAAILRAPADAFARTVSYVRICCAGFVFIISYNVLGSIFRGVGDSVMPLISVAIASVFNIAGDLLFVAKMGLGASGAALATVMAQAFSVMLSMIIIKRRPLPFRLHRSMIKIDRDLLKRIISLGSPIVLQDLLVSFSFMFIMAITNSRGVITSAGVGVAEKLCAFIMLVPSAYSQAVSAFVAQNIGAGKPDRARKALRYGIVTSVAIGVVIAYFSYFHGDLMAAIFSKDARVIDAAWLYLKAYSIDTIMVSFLFCFIGYFNGCGKTFFTMVQGVFTSFAIRIPFAYFVSRVPGSTIFHIGIATPMSSFVRVMMCVVYYTLLRKKEE